MYPKDLEDNIDSEFDEDTEGDETNEDTNDSENTNGESEGDEDSENNSQDEKEESDEDDSTYRPSEKKEKETVPLKKHLALKAKLRELKGSSPEINQQALEEFAEESNLKVDVVKKLATLIISQATKAATKAAEDRVAPIVLEKISRENTKAFDTDFEKSIIAKYPDLANKKEVFKKIAFSKDFLHLKNLEAIRAEFFPDSKPSDTKEVKKATVEGGSQGGGKEVEKVDFATLKTNPKQYEAVMKDPVAREKYYSWQDEQDANK